MWAILIFACMAAMAPMARAVRERDTDDKSAGKSMFVDSVESSATATEELTHQAGTCDYKTPAKAAAAGEGYSGMEKLTTSAGLGKPYSNTGFYAYGPAFQGKDQIAAWSYDQKTRKVEFWWSKSWCEHKCKDCCEQGPKSNHGTYWSSSLDPSYNGQQFRADEAGKGGDVIKVPFGKLKTERLEDGRYVFKDSSTGCMVDHLYVCTSPGPFSKGEFLIVYLNPKKCAMKKVP